MPHLATTYAAVNSLITLSGPKALSSINRCTSYSMFLLVSYLSFTSLDIDLVICLREKLYTFLLRMKDASGGFRYDAFYLFTLFDQLPKSCLPLYLIPSLLYLSSISFGKNNNLGAFLSICNFIYPF